MHGADAVVAAERVSAALFSGDTQALLESDLEELRQDGLSNGVCEPGVGLLTVLVEAGLVKSTGEARKLIQGNGIKLNGVSVSDVSCTLDFDDALFQRFYLIRKGKKNYHLVVSQ